MNPPARAYLTVLRAGGCGPEHQGDVPQIVTLGVPASVPPLAAGDVLIIAARNGTPPEPEPATEAQAA